MRPMDDKEIIKLFNERSEQGVVELSNKYGRLFGQIARNVLKDESDVEECINDAILDVWNQIPPQEPESLGAFVCGIVRRKAINRYKLNSRQKRNSVNDLAFYELEECLDNDETVEKLIEEKELSKIIDGFLASLDKVSRVMFVRRYWYSESVTSIAKRVNKSPHAVTIKLARIREKFKKYLIEKGEYEYER